MAYVTRNSLYKRWFSSLLVDGNPFKRAADPLKCDTMTRFDEMIKTAENVALVNRAVVLPFIQKKYGLQVVDQGSDYGQIVTIADQKVSQYLLNGGIKGIVGQRRRLEGSFSEEDDTPLRLHALELDQDDPIDGTGDLVKTYQTENVMGSTTLVSRLIRQSPTERFTPAAGLIFDNITETVLVSDGHDIGLFKVNEDGKLREAKYERMQPEEWRIGRPIRINRREAYPQHNYDEFRMLVSIPANAHVEPVPVGGAGRIAMQFFRNYIQPTDKWGADFAKLEPIDICFNAQPDWKTWDTDPTEVIANALGLPPRTDIYGDPLTANAANRSLKDMVHTTGYVLASDRVLRNFLTSHAVMYEAGTGRKLTEKNY
jgi:hypothetical protein